MTDAVFDRHGENAFPHVDYESNAVKLYWNVTLKMAMGPHAVGTTLHHVQVILSGIRVLQFIVVANGNALFDLERAERYTPLYNAETNEIQSVRVATEDEINDVFQHLERFARLAEPSESAVRAAASVEHKQQQCDRCSAPTLVTAAAWNGFAELRRAHDNKRVIMTCPVECDMFEGSVFVTFCSTCGQIQGQWPATDIVEDVDDDDDDDD